MQYERRKPRILEKFQIKLRLVNRVINTRENTFAAIIAGRGTPKHILFHIAFLLTIALSVLFLRENTGKEMSVRRALSRVGAIIYILRDSWPLCIIFAIISLLAAIGNTQKFIFSYSFYIVRASRTFGSRVSRVQSAASDLRRNSRNPVGPVHQTYCRCREHFRRQNTEQQY